MEIDNHSDLPASVEFISVHIPKTAGSTFGKVFLQQLYRPEDIFYDYEFLTLEETLAKIPAQTKVIHGHFPAEKYVGLAALNQYIVWLRHPFNQLISWYFFWLAPPNGKTYDEQHRDFLEKKLSFREFLEMPYAKNSGSSRFPVEATRYSV